jgi:Protein of unknown function (DUF1826)
VSSVALKRTKQRYYQAFLSDDIADLARIYDPDINICIVERQINESAQGFVEHLLKRTQSISIIENIEFATFNFFVLLPDNALHPGHREFCKDIAYLCGLYRDLFDLERIGLRLRTLDHAMCPKFHFDSVACRLVCTYGGAGTQWLEDAYIDRRKLGTGSGGLCDEESGLILDLDAVQPMPAYAIGLFKGSRWEGNELHGAVHRSPQITSPRLLLTLDFG